VDEFDEPVEQRYVPAAFTDTSMTVVHDGWEFSSGTGFKFELETSSTGFMLTMSSSFRQVAAAISRCEAWPCLSHSRYKTAMAPIHDGTSALLPAAPVKPGLVVALVGLPTSVIVNVPEVCVLWLTTTVG
jgi:hypothetical protein